MADYSVFVTGLHDPYEVIFTIKDKKLVDMKIGEGKENMFMTDEQFAEFAKNIIDTQSMGVDAISGATIDSQAITGRPHDRVLPQDLLRNEQESENLLTKQDNNR